MKPLPVEITSTRHKAHTRKLRVCDFIGLDGKLPEPFKAMELDRVVEQWESDRRIEVEWKARYNEPDWNGEEVVGDDGKIYLVDEVTTEWVRGRRTQTGKATWYAPITMGGDAP